MTPIIPFLTSPLGIVCIIVVVLLGGRFLWHALVGLLHLVLVVAIVGVIVYALGGLPDVATPQPAAHHFRVRT